MDDLEKEAKQKEYSPEYISELLDAVRQYVPPHVMDTLHRKALPRAGGKASAKARAAQAQSQSADTQAATEAHQAQDTQAEVNAEVNKQPLPSGVDEDDDDDGKADGACEEQDTQKCRDKNKMEKTAHGKQDAPVASTGSWDAGAAQKRLLAWAGGPDKENVDWQKYGKGFLYHDPDNADNAGGYKFPVADIINGKFQISRVGLAAAAGRINQSSGIPASELDSMKATLRSYYKDIGEDAPDNIAKETAEEADADCEKVKTNCMKLKEKAKKSVKKSDVPTFIGKRPILTFVAASPGEVESIRKSALVGSTGKIFNDEYLTPLGLTRDNVAITYLVPQLLKDESGKVREPTVDEIESWQPWFRDELAKVEAGSKSKRKIPIIALGHTVKKALERDVEFTMPHPNSLYTPRTKDELQRKRLQVSKALEARYRKN